LIADLTGVMAETTLLKSAPILIIGAGVFGLSTALHLGQRGYTNVTVLDKQPYDKTLYAYDKGCDAASAGYYSTSTFPTLPR
jgi:sarcosine oxidase/L-pipecolate oxidase